VHFPTITAQNLARETLNLPGGFEGDFNLCLIAFRRWHQPLVNSWIPLARHLEETHAGFRYYEFPVIRRVNPLYQSFIDQGMRAGIPDRVARHKTITLYTNKAPFRGRWRSATRTRSTCVSSIVRARCTGARLGPWPRRRLTR